MHSVFFSQSEKDKKIVLEVLDYLQARLISCWIDENNIAPGERILSEINQGIESTRIFMPFISNHFLRSDYCSYELETAINRTIKKEITIFPVLLEKKENLVESKGNLLNLLESPEKFMEFDQYDLNKSCEEIHAGITSHLKVAFDKIVEVTIDGVLGQLIRLRMTEDSLEESTLRKLNFNIEKFVETDENRKKPIRQGLPVFLTGRAPNWLITSLLIPLRNLRTVYVYNQPSEKYICVYDKTPNRKEFGRVLRANKR